MSYFASQELAFEVQKKNRDQIDELLLHEEYRINHPFVLTVLIDDINGDMLDIEWLKWLRTRGLEIFPLANRIRLHVQLLIQQDMFNESKAKSEDAIKKYGPVMEFLYAEWAEEQQEEL